MIVATIAALTITLTPTPCGHTDWLGCYDTAHQRIELAPTADEFTMIHELGHAFEQQMMRTDDREWFRRQTSQNPSVIFEERFADVYASCAIHGLMPKRRGVVVLGVYGARYPIGVYRRMCRFLRYHTEGVKWLA